jgi:hypothetical protein
LYSFSLVLGGASNRDTTFFSAVSPRGFVKTNESIKRDNRAMSEDCTRTNTHKPTQAGKWPTSDWSNIQYRREANLNVMQLSVCNEFPTSVTLPPSRFEGQGTD